MNKRGNGMRKRREIQKGKSVLKSGHGQSERAPAQVGGRKSIFTKIMFGNPIGNPIRIIQEAHMKAAPGYTSTIISSQPRPPPFLSGYAPGAIVERNKFYCSPGSGAKKHAHDIRRKAMSERGK